MALSKAVKEVTYVVKLQSMRISVKILVMVRVDNARAIFMAGNVTVLSHPKHMDIR